jgi:CDP-diacylglycerol--glycerol-3-phosphate 3-phosphatidyltransferase
MSVPNILTASRIVLTALLFIPAFRGWRTVFVAGFAIAFLTDLLDGYLARKLGQESYFGMRFDSMADYFLIASGIVWICWLEPTIFRAHSAAWAVIAVAVIMPQVVSFLRLGKNAGFHLYSSKVAAFMAVMGFLHAIINGRHSAFLFYAFAAAAILNGIEETLLCLLVRNPYDDLRPSLLSYMLPGAVRRYFRPGKCTV